MHDSVETRQRWREMGDALLSLCSKRKKLVGFTGSLWSVLTSFRATWSFFLLDQRDSKAHFRRYSKHRQSDSEAGPQLPSRGSAPKKTATIGVSEAEQWHGCLTRTATNHGMSCCLNGAIWGSAIEQPQAVVEVGHSNLGISFRLGSRDFSEDSPGI